MGQLASDNFTRANENPLSNGGTWTLVPGGWVNLQLASDLVEPASTNQDGGTMYWNAVSWPNDQYAQITSAVLANLNNLGDDHCAVVRAQANGAIYLGGPANQQSGTTGLGNPCYIFIGYVNSSIVETDLAQVVMTANVGDVWKLVAHGPTLILYQNGTPVLIGADGNLTAGNAGAHVKVSTAVTNSKISAWAAGSPALNIANFSDTFIRSNGALGSNWLSVNVNSPTIVSNQATNSAASLYSDALSIGADYSANQWAQATVSEITNGNFSGVLVRGSGNGTASQYSLATPNFCCYTLVLNNNYLAIQKLTGLTPTSAGTTTNLQLIPQSGQVGDVIRLEIKGTTLTAYRNGVVVTTATDSSLSGGHPGVHFYSTGTGLTNFSSGSLTNSSQVGAFLVGF